MSTLAAVSLSRGDGRVGAPDQERPGDQPEAQVRRDDERVRDHGRERSTPRRHPAGRPVEGSEAAPPRDEHRPVPHPSARRLRRCGSEGAPARSTGQGVQVDGRGRERRWRRTRKDRAGDIVGKKRFRLAGPADETLGSIDAENWRSWDFAIHDASGREVGRITKKWAGILREGFTTADRYLLSISGEVSGDLRGLMVASAAGIDTALKQDDTGGFGFGGLDFDV